MEVIGYDIPVWVILSLTIIFIGYKYVTRSFGVFRAMGVNGPTPWPILGTSYASIRKGDYATDKELIAKYGKVVGTFQGTTPMLVVADLDMVKQIMVSQITR